MQEPWPASGGQAKPSSTGCYKGLTGTGFVVTDTRRDILNREFDDHVIDALDAARSLMDNGDEHLNAALAAPL